MALSKVVNGRVVTNTDVKPPIGWTVNYEDFGSETEWGEVRPLFRTLYSSNEVIFIIEINEQYYVYNGGNGWVQRIITPTDLKGIVGFINEQGWFRLETENLDA
ncbi:hypothetical protein NW752_003303 [Fusarium irregulare]|uniref:Uncharacterized protein n=1 Tax=Fusarium irregulare TaxID=2494466 RepID=A0A9W8UBC5_9HYPO|nr:hypothetical protein NW766_004372 [Fusarium irregulare]KAJ4022848.1 hypothetical protein NW752_003303 [Fusarium irregulare]